MKRLFLSVLALSLQMLVKGQSPSKTLLSGSIPDMANQKLTLSHLGKPIADVTVSADGSFSQILPKISPGFYQTNLNYHIYLEPGMNLYIAKLEKGFDMKGAGSAENALIKDIQDLQWKVLSVKTYNLTDALNMTEPDVFLGKISQYKQELAQLVSKANVSKSLGTILVEMGEYDAKNFIAQYKYQYGIDPVKKDSASRYLSEVIKSKKAGEPLDRAAMQQYSALTMASRIKRLSADDSQKLEVLENFDLNNPRMYASSISYRKLLDDRLQQFTSSEVSLTPSLKRQDPSELKLYLINKHVTDPLIRESLMFEAVKNAINRRKGADVVYTKYQELAKDKDYLSIVKQMYVGLQALKPGAPSPKFAYKDVNGNSLSSEDLKGSYVYIDFWATWCQPCLAEIPSLKELQKSYEGKDIRFVSISTDAVKDTQKWKDLVAKLELQGPQLLVDKSSEFYNFYKVNTIPRFVLLDKEGKIVDADAKRPSNPALREELNKLLN